MYCQVSPFVTVCQYGTNVVILFIAVMSWLKVTICSFLHSKNTCVSPFTIKRHKGASVPRVRGVLMVKT